MKKGYFRTNTNTNTNTNNLFPPIPSDTVMFIYDNYKHCKETEKEFFADIQQQLFG